MNYWEIDKSIPIPAGGRGGKSKYPFQEMEVGDSVFFPGSNTQGKEMIYAHNYARRNGKKFSGRSIDGGLRVWRVK